MSFKHIPTLSKKNVEFVNYIIEKENIDLLIEYGSGNSTLFFLNKLKTKNLKFISIENTKFWFYENIKTIKKIFNPKNSQLNRRYWTSDDYKGFLNTKTLPFTKIIDGRSKIEIWKRYMKLGPFYRFEKDSKSRLAGKLFFLLPFFKPFFHILNNLLIKLNKFKNEKSEWKCNVENIYFNYKLISPSIKDQFGESPNINEYVDAGLEMIKEKNEIKNILFMIDGGPRHYIVEKILSKNYKKKIHLCLFDAHRPEYKTILDKYGGEFISGEEQLIDGTIFYTNFKNEKVKKEILSKELWYFSN